MEALKITQVLQATDEDQKKDILEELIDRPQEDVVRPLIMALNDDSIAVRELAVEAISKCVGSKTSPQVVDLLYLEDVEVRNYACEIIEKSGYRFLPNILSVLEQETDPDVVKFLVDSLARMKGVPPQHEKMILDAFESQLDSGEENILIATIEGIGMRQHQTLWPKVVKLINKSYWLQLSVVQCFSVLNLKGNPARVAEVDVGTLNDLARTYLNNYLKGT